MRFTLSAFADEAGGSIREQIAALNENDIRYLEIRGVDGESIADLTAEKAREVRRRLDDAGILRFRKLARHMERRGRRRAAESGAPQP